LHFRFKHKKVRNRQNRKKKEIEKNRIKKKTKIEVLNRQIDV
jgi:hypothetical protein